jgi:hypothetical protein
MGAHSVDGSDSTGFCARGERDGCDPKRVVLLHPFGSNFQAEDVYAGYLMPELAEKSPYPVDRYEVLLMMARFNELSRMRRLWSTSKRFSRGSARWPRAHCRIP